MTNGPSKKNPKLAYSHSFDVAFPLPDELMSSDPLPLVEINSPSETAQESENEAIKENILHHTQTKNNHLDVVMGKSVNIAVPVHDIVSEKDLL